MSTAKKNTAPKHTVKYLLLLTILTIAYQNCSDVNLVDRSSNKGSDFSLFNLNTTSLSNDNAVASSGDNMVTCGGSSVSLYDLNIKERIDQKFIAGTCLDISIDASEIAVSNHSGDIYIFSISNDQLQLKQTLSKPSSSNSFSGYANTISLKNNILVVGDHYHKANERREGSAYIFEKNNGLWSYKQQVLASDFGVDDLFGSQVKTNGTEVFVSSRYNNNKGAVYAFYKIANSWVEYQKIDPPENIANQQFGFSMDADSNNLAIAAVAVASVTSPQSTGSVYTYKKNGEWEFREKIISDNPNEEDFFGYRVVLNYPTLLISAPQERSDSLHGYVNTYVYHQAKWQFSQTLKDPQFSDFGTRLSASNNYAIIKSRGENSLSPLLIYQQEAN